ncbi:MAG: hypothetical protein LRY67_00855 [Gammaproteobacteria bacterium]|nr:hypothetical protein [Gammaproteobacteria bacterium]MCD8524356.1 hypothetical protein [Gammaproteobacteria bacterium]MCD8541999.1 hypothetical protein [Gammaproteobacteria bacterium]
MIKRIRSLLKRPPVQLKTREVSPFSSVSEFSGDNLYDTELDLARAYLELGEYHKAKHLLKSVITHGTPSQILDARNMFSELLKRERSL